MGERNLLTNGGFIDRLYGWAASHAEFVASDGDERFGMVEIKPGGKISQQFRTSTLHRLTFHLAVKPAVSLSNGNCVLTVSTLQNEEIFFVDILAAAGIWNSVDVVRVIPDGSYVLTIRNNSEASVMVDDVWIWNVAISRQEIARRVHRELGALATNEITNWSYEPNGDETEGDYTVAINDALWVSGAIDPATDEIDILWLDASRVIDCVRYVRDAMLKRAQMAFALKPDYRLGELEVRANQVSENLARITERNSSESPEISVRNFEWGT